MYPRRPCRRVCEYLIFAQKAHIVPKQCSRPFVIHIQTGTYANTGGHRVKLISSKASIARLNTQQYIATISVDEKTPTANDVAILGKCMNLSLHKSPVRYPGMLPKFRTVQHPVYTISAVHCTVMVKYHSSIFWPAHFSCVQDCYDQTTDSQFVFAPLRGHTQCP